MKSYWKLILGGVLFLAAIIIFALMKPGAFLSVMNFLRQVR